jgi:two-component system, chemotaxis family, response regulator Rcp1
MVMENKIEILLIEDNRADVVFFQEALKECNIDSDLHVARDGVEGMAFLRKEGTYASSPRPDLIFLDLNMPRKPGFEVLSEIKSDEGLRRIPVIIVTSSQNHETIKVAYDLQANCYAAKCIELSKLNQLIDFWLRIAKLPPK